MSILSAIKAFISGVRSMFATSEVKRIVGGEIAITTTMTDKIDTWRNMYIGAAEWLNDKEGIISLRLEQAIAREFADVVLNELESSVSIEQLETIYKAAIRELNESLQEGIALGALCIKPLGPGSAVEYVAQGDFVPVAYDSRGRLTDVIFVELRLKGDSDYYRRLERHSVSDAGLVITNKAYHGHSESDLGNEISLSTFEDWAKLAPEIKYPDWKKPDFGYYKNPIKNTIDKSFNGVSIYDSAIQLIKRADRQFGRLDWEYESAERALIADIDAIPAANSLGYKTRPKERLVKTLDGGDGSGVSPYHEFSPELRGDGYIEGLEAYKREIETAVGLSFGDLSKAQEIEKTATEIRASKKRKFNRVTATQDNLKDCLSDLVDALAFYNGLVKTGYEFKIDFHDSIITDEEADRDQLRRDLASGVLNAWEYRMKVYGEDEATAKANVPTAPSVMPDAFGGV